MEIEKDYESLKKRIYDEYPNIMNRLALRGVDTDDVADIASKVMITAMRKRHQLRDADKLVPWLRKIADNEVRGYLRKKAKLWEREVTVISDMESGDEIDILETIAAEHTVEEIVCSIETKHMLMELIDYLNEKERVIFKMHNLDGYKLNEIARYLGLKESTVRSIHSRTSKKLKARAEKLWRKEDRYD